LGGTTSSWTLKTKILDCGKPTCSAALRTLGNKSGWTTKNLMSAVLTAWASSYAVYDGLVPANIPPAAITPRKKMQYSICEITDQI
jgi:hypothetical protein